MEENNIYCIVNTAVKIITSFLRDEILEHWLTGTLNLKETSGLSQFENLADNDCNCLL